MLGPLIPSPSPPEYLGRREHGILLIRAARLIQFITLLIAAYPTVAAKKVPK